MPATDPATPVVVQVDTVVLAEVIRECAREVYGRRGIFEPEDAILEFATEVERDRNLPKLLAKKFGDYIREG